MKIAIIGGGTAGFMAAAHLTKYLPAVDLYHIYDSRIPTIGVGEGTTPPFLKWLHEITTLSFSDLQARCEVTRKFGIEFENWGTKHKKYLHYFSPLEGVAYHISAAKLVELLQDYVTATYLDRKVTGVTSDGRQATIIFENNPPLTVDFCFDARGFPATLDNRHAKLSCIPTNAALIRRGPASDFQTATRAVARPYGWIFVIPLTTHRSFGYIYNDTINSGEEIEVDFHRFLQTEGVKVIGSGRWFRFPNFTQRIYFDGAVFRIGNAASFLEPLEATAIGMIVLQLQVASIWLYDKLLGLSRVAGSDQALNVVNETLLDTIQKVALFISWHYAQGSCFQTPFWRFAISSFEQVPDSLTKQDIFDEFEQYLHAGAQFPESLGSIKSPRDFNDMAIPQTSISKTFGGFLDISFAQVGYGIDYFANAGRRIK